MILFTISFLLLVAVLIWFTEETKSGQKIIDKIFNYFFN